MKTVFSDFVKKLVVGATVNNQLWIEIGERECRLVSDLRNCVVTSHSGNYIKISSEDGEISWAEWPKEEEFLSINNNKAALNFEGGCLIYEFEES